MKVGVFLRTAGDGTEALRKRHVLQSFHAGLVAEGVDVQLADADAYEACDVAVVYGGRPSPDRASTAAAREEVFSSHVGALLFIETPLIGRSVYRRSALAARARKLLGLRHKRFADSYDYYRVGVGGFLRDDGDFANSGSPGDRWREQASRFDLRLEPYRTAGRHVLIVGQSPGDASLRGADIFEWMHKTATAARALTDRPIVIRPHPVTLRPMMGEFERRFRELPGVVLDYPPSRPVTATLKGCWVMIAYSSSATIDGLIAGVPCITTDPANFAWPVSDHEIERIDDPTLYDREPWLHDLAYAQWSPQEMASGAVWRHLRPAIARAQQQEPAVPAPPPSFQTARPTAAGGRAASRRRA